MKCQSCGVSPADPRLSACAHLYCSKCVSSIRKAAASDAKVAECVTCKREIGKKCTVVATEQVEEWRNEYAGDDDGDGNGDDGEDEADEAAADNK